MLDFEPDEEQIQIKDAIQKLAVGELGPAARQADTDGEMSATILDVLWGTGFPLLQGEQSSDRSPVLNAIVLEELAVADATGALALAAPVAFLQALLDQGSPAQCSTLLPMFQGDNFHAAAIAVLEPRLGADVSELVSEAVRDGDGWRLNGHKALVPLASTASHFLVIAKTDKGRDAFIVEREAAGVCVEEPVPTLGLRALGLGGVVFKDVQLGASQRLGDRGEVDVQRIIDASRIGLAAVMTGLARGVLEYVIPYAKDRVAHGTALARKQSIAFKIADMHNQLTASRLLTWRAADELGRGLDVGRSAQLAYTYAARHSMATADEGVQILGGHGYVRAHPIEMWYRNARSLSMLEGLAGV